MIILFILNFLFLLMGLFLSFLPVVSVLPFGLDSLFSEYIGYLMSFLDEFWFLQRVLFDFSLLLTVLLLMLVVKAFMGSRVENNY